MGDQTILYLDGSGDISGAEVSLLTLVTNLNHSRYTPVVVLPSEGSFSARLREHSISTTVMGMRPLTLVSLSPLKVAWSALRVLPFVLSLARFIKDNGVDLVHVNSYRIGIPCSVAARLAGVPVVWHIRDIASSRLKREAVALLADMLAHRTIAISNAVAATLRTGSPKLRVIYNGVATGAFENVDGGPRVREELGVAPSTSLIGNVGQFVPWKGQDVLIRAMAEVTVVIPEAKLLLVGYNVSTVWTVPTNYAEFESRLYDLVAQLGLKDKVMFTGFREDIASVMQALDVYVHAAVRPEPFGRVLVEAMGAGKPVVAPGAGGIPEIVEHGRSGLLFPPGDVKALAEAIITLLLDEDKRDAMGEAGIRIACRKFPVGEYVRQVESVYAELLDKTL